MSISSLARPSTTPTPGCPKWRRRWAMAHCVSGSPTTPGCIVDGDWIVKWVNKVSVSGSTVKQWVATLRGPRKTVKLRRNDFESCYHCHKTSVKLAGRRYQGVPLYYLVGKIDDNLDNNNWGAFNRRLATKGYLIDLKNAKRKVTISSKLIAARAALADRHEADGEAASLGGHEPRAAQRPAVRGADTES